MIDPVLIELPRRPERSYIPEGLELDNWNALEKYFIDLANRSIESVHDLEQWILDRNELETAIAEELGWRYIKMTCDTSDKAARESYQLFVEKVEPQIYPFSDKLNRKLISNPFVSELDKDEYFTYIRSVKKSIEIFREENIALFTEMQLKEREFSSITGGMTVVVNGEEKTMQQAASYLEDTDRNFREEVYFKIQERRKTAVNDLDNLFTKLIQIRHKVALNAGFSNYRDYKFAAMGRFDYTHEDCFKFHDAIQSEILPLMEKINVERRTQLGVNELRPWDLAVDISGKKPLKPFDSGEALVDKTIECFYRLRPYFGERLQIMKEMGHLDLESRKGKAPGGYNYPLYEIGVPFIFMNAAGTLQDVRTMTHEGGHAIHSFLTRELKIKPFKSTPSEVAELASMSMELFSMDHWDVFFENEEDMVRAKKDQLQSVISVFPWVATIDRFQHWIYTHPNHTKEERMKEWLSIFNQFRSNTVNWEGLEEYTSNGWQKQLHLFEVPFYYIEYAMAQLGAIAMWKQYKLNPEQALDNYIGALSLGYTKPIGAIYERAGIRFDFSLDYVKELANFVKKELDALG